MARLCTFNPVPTSCLAGIHRWSIPNRFGLHVLEGQNVLSNKYVYTIKTGATFQKRQELQIWMQKGVGFGKQATELKTKHKILTLDVSKAEKVETYTVFAQKLSNGEPISKWESIGEILLEDGSDLVSALKERRKKLLAAAKHQYPIFMLLKDGEDLQYGFRKILENSDDEKEDGEITIVDVKGKEPETSVAAILRADDGTKVPTPKRF